MHAGNLAVIGHFPEADTADAELADDAVDTSAAGATAIVPGGELGRLAALDH